MKKSADSSACWNQSSTRYIDKSELETSTRAELHCLISGGDVSGSPTSASPHRVFLFSGASPVRFFSHGGREGAGGWPLFAKPSFMQIMQAFTQPSLLQLHIRSGHASTTPKTPPRCFGLASEGPPRRPQIHHAYKSCIAFVFV